MSEPTEPTGPTYEPRTWFSVTVTDDTETCKNYQRVWTTSPVYSYDGLTVQVGCGLCGQRLRVLTATKLDPQPVFDE